MANPEAVMRAAQAGPSAPPMDAPQGMPPSAPKPPMGGPKPPMGGPKPPEAGGGLDGMVKALEGVGAFLQAQGPGAQEALGHFQALVQSMAKMGGGGAPGPDQAAPDNGMPKRVHESAQPGVQVL